MSKWSEHGHQFMVLRASGMSYRKIADELGLAKNTVLKWGKLHRQRIQDLAAERTAKFLEEHLVELESRLALRAEQIQRIRLELQERDYSEMDSTRLLNLLARFLEDVRREVAPVRVQVENPLASYERVLVQCLQLPDGTRMEDIPDLAWELVRAGTEGKKTPELEENREEWREKFEATLPRGSDPKAPES